MPDLFYTQIKVASYWFNRCKEAERRNAELTKELAEIQAQIGSVRQNKEVTHRGQDR